MKKARFHGILNRKGAPKMRLCDPAGTELEPFIGRFKSIESVERYFN